VPDTVLLQFPTELALAPPGDVLASVVGEDLGRHAVGRQGCTEHLDDQGGRLGSVQAVTGDEPAVVVHECDQVDAAVLPLEHEGEQVSLPQLVRFGPLERAHGWRVRPRGGLFHLVTRLVQHSAY